LGDFEKVAPYLLPKDPSVNIPSLWHCDLHHDNVFVDPGEPSKVLAVHIAPLFQQATTPAFLADFEGPKPAEGLSIIPCPAKNFDELSPAEQKKAKALRTQQSLYKLYEIQSARQENAAIFKALQYSGALGSQIIFLISQVFNDGEPIIRGQLIQVAREWDRIVWQRGTVVCFLPNLRDGR